MVPDGHTLSQLDYTGPCTVGKWRVRRALGTNGREAHGMMDGGDGWMDGWMDGWIEWMMDVSKSLVWSMSLILCISF